MSPHKDSLLYVIIGCLLPIFFTTFNYRAECVYCCALSVFYILIFWGKIGILRYIDSICAFFVFFLSFVRYYLIPLLIICDTNYFNYNPYGFGANGKYFEYGIFMTMWEMLFFSIYFSLVLPKWYHMKTKMNITMTKNLSWPWIVIILLFSIMILVSPNVLSDYSFVFDLKPDETVMEEYVHKSLLETIAVIGSRVVKIIIPIPFLCYLYSKYKRNKSFKYYLLSLIVLIFFYGFIIEGNSRNSIIMPATAAMFFLLKFYPRYGKTTNLVLISVIVLISILSLIWKSFLGDVSGVKNSMSFWISYLEVYFAGISNMGKAVYAYHITDILSYPSILFNDICRNVPFLNYLADNSNTSSFYYVNVWGRTDQVIPATGNGLFYFGYIFAPCVSMVIIQIAHWFEKKALLAKTMPEYLIYCYSCVVISYNTFNSLSIMLMKLTIILLPLSFALYLSKLLQKKHTI